jgi:hypothetical protein
LSYPSSDYCREIEAYLCRKNDGHLIRIAGPSFELVSRWAEAGIPLKIAFAGIDRYFERYYRKGTRRRPVRIDFCDADVLDIFEEWRRAAGLPSAEPASADADEGDRPRGSLPSHLSRVLMRLTDVRVAGQLGPEAEAPLEEVAREIDRAHLRAKSLRGEERRMLLERLAALDRGVLDIAQAALGAAALAGLEQAGDEELAPFRERLDAAAFARARRAIVERLIRERFGLPTITFG